MFRALITGGSGQLGSDLASQLDGRAVALSREALDITDPVALDAAITRAEPDVIFNCAAFHNVDVCETERERAWEVNVEAVRRLAEYGPKLVHISTNYVFDGAREEPYSEFDTPSPRSMYAITKLAGEHVALAYGDDSLVVRTGGLYGLHGSASKGGNFVERMLRRARDGNAIGMVSDQRVQPTFTADLAAALIGAVESGTSGVLHLTNDDECSWFDFTCTIMRNAGVTVPIEAVTTTTEPGQPARPLNGVLARPATDVAGLPRLRTWDAALADYMSQAGLAANS